VLDEHGNLDRVNPAFERVLGYAESDVIGKGLMHIVRVDDWAAFLRTFTAVEPAPVRLVRKGSGEVGVRMIAFRFKNQRGYLVLRPIGKSDVDTP
jgi:PAS domain S-box-containing protein